MQTNSTTQKLIKHVKTGLEKPQQASKGKAKQKAWERLDKRVIKFGMDFN